MKPLFSFLVLILMTVGCKGPSTDARLSSNPFFPELNEAVSYDRVNAQDIKEYVNFVLVDCERRLAGIREDGEPDFDGVFVAYDRVINDLTKASNNSFMLYWVSPDSLSRRQGLLSFQQVDSMMNSLSSDAQLFIKMKEVEKSEAFERLDKSDKKFAEDVIKYFKYAGVDLAPDKLEQFKKLKAEINDLSSQYSTNMNTANEVLVLDEEGAEGLPENFKKSYAAGGGYEIPVMPATRRPVMNNASREATRKAYIMKYQNRAADKNLTILDLMVLKRYQLAQLMGYESYAAYTTSMKMSKNPENVWSFLNDLIERTGEKALKDHEILKEQRNAEYGIQSQEAVKPWDLAYLRNQILINKYDVDQELVRSYLQMDKCLAGMIAIYEELLDLEIKQLENPPVWYDGVLLYEVRHKGKLTGRFYLDLYPRANKESWFYGVNINPGCMTEEGYEVPTCMLLGNFTGATDDLPSLLSFGELSTLFHEFGHIMENMTYDGKYASQAGSKEDFSESMSQIFENWIWDYDILSSFAVHYESGEVLPREIFENMLKAKNVTSGLDAQNSLASSVYDMELYDRYDPENPVDTDELWRKIDGLMAVPMHIEGTHSQANWIHINTHPTYYYGYLWAEVYAQDMFTVFRENGLRDSKTGIRYREEVLSNGRQRDILESVENFLGRKSNNEAYIKSLGLD